MPYEYIYIYIQKNEWLEFPLIFKKCFMFNKIQQLTITFEIDYFQKLLNYLDYLILFWSLFW